MSDFTADEPGVGHRDTSESSLLTPERLTPSGIIPRSNFGRPILQPLLPVFFAQSRFSRKVLKFQHMLVTSSSAVLLIIQSRPQLYGLGYPRQPSP